MLSKSKGQILRVAVVLHVLFHIDTPMAAIPCVIGTDAVKASIDLVDMSIQHAAYLAGIGNVLQTTKELAQGAHKRRSHYSIWTVPTVLEHLLVTV